jgi:hypothetical protein
MSGGRGDGDEGRDPAGALRALKRRGCLVLLTGRTPPATSRRALRRALGSPRVPRRRVVVLADPAPEAPDPSADGSADAYGAVPDARVVHAGDVVDAAAPGGLDVVLDRLDAALDETDADAGADADAEGSSRSPARLRVVVDAATPLVDAWGVEAVGAFLADLGDVARSARGIAAARLDLDDADPVTADLAAASDVRIELRDDCDVGCACPPARDGPCQRVHLPGRGPSPWTPL